MYIVLHPVSDTLKNTAVYRCSNKHKSSINYPAIELYRT